MEWTVAAGPEITDQGIVAAEPSYQAKLDGSFFRVRLDRATDLQRAYLRAMAQLGPDPQKASDVAEVIGRNSTNVAPTRAELINMGLLYTPTHGLRGVHRLAVRQVHAARHPHPFGPRPAPTPPEKVTIQGPRYRFCIHADENLGRAVPTGRHFTPCSSQ